MFGEIYRPPSDKEILGCWLRSDEEVRVQPLELRRLERFLGFVAAVAKEGYAQWVQLALQEVALERLQLGPARTGSTQLAFSAGMLR